MDRPFAGNEPAEMNGMPAELVDTNILIYAFDSSEPVKMAAARETLGRLAQEGDGCTSTQVLSEFAVNARRKCTPALSADEVLVQLGKIERFLKVLLIEPQHVEMAVRASEKLSLSYWDALIWAVAKDNQVSVIVSEDGPSGSRVDGVLFQNPFAT